MRRGRVMLAALAAAAAAPGLGARTVDYAPDDAALLVAAGELKIAPVSALPDRGAEDVALVVAPQADHETLALGMYCSAFKVLNPIGALMPRLVSAWDRDGSLVAPGDAATVAVRITGARSYRRCLELSEANVRCVTTASMTGTVEADGRSLPVRGDAERDASVGGFCGNLARGIAVVSREAGIALIADARAKLAALRAN